MKTYGHTDKGPPRAFDGRRPPIGGGHKQITPDASIFKLARGGFTVIYFDANGSQVVDTAEGGEGLVSILRQALSC